MTAVSDILLVEDHEALARTYQGFLRAKPYRVRHVTTGKAALAALGARPAAVLLDLKLPDMDGMAVLKEIAARGQGPAVIVITAHGSMQTAIEAIRSGAKDYLVKPFSAERLALTLENALEHQALATTVRVYREQIDRQGFQGFIGASLAMQAVYRALESAASSKATVFLTGESGTGKEVAARAVHELSGRQGAFVPLNCGAIPKELMESEIFGHVKGAFTGAHAERAGAARQAHGGTLFLDEVCEMDPQLQTKLLRFLQTGQITRVGGSGAEEVDVRILCATNRDPAEEVREGRFREDLYYRLHVIPIHLPPLRERGEDVILIADALFQRFAAEEGRAFDHLTEEAKTLLLDHAWPGNVRELQNVVRNTVVMHDAEVVEAGMLPLTAAGPSGLGRSAPRPTPPGAGSRQAARHQLDRLAERIRPLAEVERRTIEDALDLCAGDVRKAAVFLEIAPATIYRKLKGWGVVAGRG
jgi:DNA-binding NtrC family response regulator